MADEKEWTIMVYLAGDNNLSEDMITALNGLKYSLNKLNSEKKLNLIAVYDSSYPTVPILHYVFTKENCDKTLKECEYKYVHPQRKFRGTEEIQERAYIIDFVRWSKETFPADNYALILSGHSDGIIGRTMFQDSNPSSALNLGKLKYILNRSKKWLGDGKKFSLIGFDSCLMSMAEVGYELKDITDVLVASEGNVPTSGWTYFEIFSSVIEVLNLGNLESRKFAEIIVENYLNVSNNYKVGGRSVNISACDLKKATDLKNAVNDLALQFYGILSEPIEDKFNNDSNTCNINAVITEKLIGLIHKSHYYSQTFMYEQGMDLGDFVKTLHSNCGLMEKELEIICGKLPKTEVARKLKKNLKAIKSKCLKIQKALKNYVIKNGFCGPEFQFSTGVSIFSPWTLLAFLMVSYDYKNLRFSRDCDWINFIWIYSLLTYRATGAPLYEENSNFLDWRNQVKDVSFKDFSFKDKDGKDVSFKDVSFKDVSFKDVSFKDVSFKDVSFKDVSFKDVSFKNTSNDNGGMGFYNFFRRFRNHPIYHDVPEK